MCGLQHHHTAARVPFKIRSRTGRPHFVSSVSFPSPAIIQDIREGAPAPQRGTVHFAPRWSSSPALQSSNTESSAILLCESADCVMPPEETTVRASLLLACVRYVPSVSICAKPRPPSDSAAVRTCTVASRDALDASTQYPWRDLPKSVRRSASSDPSL